MTPPREQGLIARLLSALAIGCRMSIKHGDRCLCRKNCGDLTSSATECLPPAIHRAAGSRAHLPVILQASGVTVVKALVS
jgi:hypothetical protein